MEKHNFLDLPATSDVGNGKYSVHVLDKYESGNAERWLNAHIESSVSVQQAWHRAIQYGTLKCNFWSAFEFKLGFFFLIVDIIIVFYFFHSRTRGWRLNKKIDMFQTLQDDSKIGRKSLPSYNK